MNYNQPGAREILRRAMRPEQGTEEHRQAIGELFRALDEALKLEGWTSAIGTDLGHESVRIELPDGRQIAVVQDADCKIGFQLDGRGVDPNGISDGALWFDRTDGLIVGPTGEDGLVLLATTLVDYVDRVMSSTPPASPSSVP